MAKLTTLMPSRKIKSFAIRLVRFLLLNHKKIVKRFLKRVLSIWLIGIPVSKLLFTISKVLEKGTRKITQSLDLLPLGAETFASLTSKRSSQAKSRYYFQLYSQLKDLPYQPLISIIVPVYKVKSGYLQEMLESVAQQIYANWQLCIVDDCSQNSELTSILENFQKRFPQQVKLGQNATNLHISGTSNVCLALASGDYCGLLDHDDRLYPNALAEMIRYINLHNKPDVLYSDERVIDGNGALLHWPFFKPDYSPFFHLCVNYTTHFSVYQTDLLKEIGGFRVGFEGSQDHDLALRAIERSQKQPVHVPFCLYQWRAHELSTAAGISKKPYAAVAGEKAVSEALERRALIGRVLWNPETGHYKLNLQPPAHSPSVAIIIPTLNSYLHISRCLASIEKNTSYKNVQIVIVDNGTTDKACLELFAQFEKKSRFPFQRLIDSAWFNFGRLNNGAACKSSADYLVLLNNDTEILSENWIENMLALASLPQAGAVGCKLLYPSGAIQHAGIALSPQNIACHVGVGLPANAPLYNQVMQSVHEVSAVTAACLMVSAKKYTEVGGLDEVNLPNGYGDIDFCLKLKTAGYQNYYTPETVVRHHESATRKITLENFEQFYFTQKWGQEIANDPYLNPNLFKGSEYKINPHLLTFELNKTDFEEVLQGGWQAFGQS